MSKKIDDIKLLIARSELNLLCLTESWLNRSISDEELAIPGYRFIRFDRDLGDIKRGGGGILCYVDNRYHFEHLSDWNICTHDIEVVWLKLNLKLTKPTYIACIYRPPSGIYENFETILEQKLLDIQGLGENDVILLGDTNLNLLSTRDCNVNKYRGFMKRFKLQSMIHEATRVTTTSATLIDHFVTTRPDLYSNAGVIDPGLSDHCLIFSSRKKKKQKRIVKYVKCRSYRQFNESAFKLDVQNLNWSMVTDCPDVDIATHLFTRMLLDVIDKHAPYRQLKLREFAPKWLNTEYLSLVDAREYWCKKFKKNPTEFNLYQKNKAINDCKVLKIELQQNYFKDKIEQHKHDSKKLWKTLKEIWPTKQRSCNIRQINGKSGLLDMANELNQFFSTVGSTLAEKIKPPDSVPMPDVPAVSNFELRPLNISEFVKFFNDMKSSTSCGTDGLTSRLLKQAGGAIAQPLLHIINLSITHGHFLTAWKSASITPLYKEGDPSQSENYRPISILPCLGKLLEKIIHAQLYSYVTDNNLLSPDQFGFRKGYSTGTCLIDFLDNIYSNIDQGRACGVLFLDLKKAFDTVDHQLLLTKLQNLGISNNSLNWFKSYLLGRSQVTRVQQTVSDSMLVTCGVPQGSVLGPLLFSLYVNNLSNTINQGTTHLYADDTAITLSSKTFQDLELKMNSALDTLSNWFAYNKLSLNSVKSKVMLFGTVPMLKKAPDLAITVGQHRLEIVDDYKYLGVKLDKHLNFSSNTNYIESKVISRISVLGKVRHILDSDTCLYLYKQLILPIIEYADYTYDGLTQYNAHTLQKLQNSAARRILQVPLLTPTAYTHQELHLDDLATRRKKHTCIELYKILNGLSPARLKSRFLYIHEVSTRDTRHSSWLDLYIKKPRLELTKRAFYFRAAYYWNSLPIQVRVAPTLDMFKSALDAYHEAIF